MHLVLGNIPDSTDKHILLLSNRDVSLMGSDLSFGRRGGRDYDIQFKHSKSKLDKK